MIRRTLLALAGAAALASLAAPRGARAQQPAAAPAPRPELALGQPAPDFALPGASRYGLLRDRIRLSDMHGKTVILAFFYQARTKG